MRKPKTIIWTALILFSLDFLLTVIFLNTSDHANEGNPLVYVHDGFVVLGMNVAYFLSILVLAKWIQRYQSVAIKARGTFDYVKKLYLSDHSRFIYVCLAFSFIHATIVSRIIVIIDWIVVGFYPSTFHSTTYFMLRRQMPFERFDILAGFLAFFVFLVLWFHWEYKNQDERICSSL